MPNDTQLNEKVQKSSGFPWLLQTAALRVTERAEKHAVWHTAVPETDVSACSSVVFLI